VIAAGEMITDSLQLERELGAGGMGSVWLAKNTALGSRVAVKVLHSLKGPPSDVARLRFEREARGLAQLDHPHVVKVFDYGVTIDGEPFIVMELLNGEDLSARLERSGPLDGPTTAAVIAQTCKVLTVAHAAGVVHRDIKPANLFLLPLDEVFVKVLDFGIARFTQQASALTQAGVGLGTPLFMSPEQFMSPEDVDHRSDLWALGVVAYQCLTGELPFAGESAAEIGMAVTTAPIRPPSQTRSGAAYPGVDAFIAKALARDKADRFQSARALADAFSAAIDSRPPLAPPVPEAGSPPAPPSIADRAVERGPLAHATTTLARISPPLARISPPPGGVSPGSVPRAPRPSSVGWILAALAMVCGVVAATALVIARVSGRPTGTARPVKSPASASIEGSAPASANSMGSKAEKLIFAALDKASLPVQSVLCGDADGKGSGAPFTCSILFDDGKRSSATVSAADGEGTLTFETPSVLRVSDFMSDLTAKLRATAQTASRRVPDR
jgi:serine/threonine protein kinase